MRDIDVFEPTRSSDGLFHAVFENAGIGVVLFDPDGRILQANRAYRAMLGYGDELVGMSYRDLTHQDDLDRATTDLGSFVGSGDSQAQLRKRYRHKSGATVWGRVTISAIRNDADEVEVLVAMVTDVTHHIEHARLQAHLLDSVRESVIVTDLDGTVTYWNHGAEELYGFTAKEAVGRPITLILPADAAEEERRRMRHALEHGKWSGRYVQRKKDGSSFWADTSLSLIRDDDGRPTGFLGIDRDISELVRREEDLRKFAQRLEDVRERERTAIAREVHDELGQTLTALKLDVAWLTGRKASDGTGARLESMRAQLDETLDAVRQLATRLRPAVLDDLGIESAITWQANEFTQRTGLRCDCDLDARALPPDRERDTALFRILQEALTNVARHAEADVVAVKMRQLPGQLRLIVEDNGRGIAEEDLDGSDSLGLLGMRERTRALGGRIDFHAAPGEGTRVVVTLPL